MLKRNPRGSDKQPRKKRADKPAGRPAAGEEPRSESVSGRVSPTVRKWFDRQPEKPGAVIERLVRREMGLLD